MYLYNSGQLVNLNGNPKIMAIVPMKSRQDVALPGTQRTCLHISSKQILQDSWLSHWENMGKQAKPLATTNTRYLVNQRNVDEKGIC